MVGTVPEDRWWAYVRAPAPFTPASFSSSLRPLEYVCPAGKSSSPVVAPVRLIKRVAVYY